MRTVSRLPLNAALLGAALGLTFALIGPTRDIVRAQTPTSYTVTLQEVLITPNGASTIASVQTQALRDDGATVLQLGPEGATARHIRIPTGLLIDTNDRDKRMSTFHVSPALVTAYIRSPQAQCRREVEEFRGEEMINSYRVAKVVTNTGASTRWYALDYSCALVRSVMEHAGGSRSAVPDGWLHRRASVRARGAVLM
jgi:hypothetical protein